MITFRRIIFLGIRVPVLVAFLVIPVINVGLSPSNPTFSSKNIRNHLEDKQQVTRIQAQDTPEPVEIQPTKMQRPTSTPIPIPPPPESANINFMIFFGIIAVVVILFGVWLNRNSFQNK